MAKRYIYFFLLLFSMVCRANTPEIDSLSQRLPRVEGQEKVDLQNELSWAYRNLLPDTAFAFADRARKLSLQIQYTKGQADALLRMGAARNAGGQYDLSIQHYLEAHALYKDLKLEAKEASCMHNTALSYYRKSDYPQAIAYFKRALTIYQKLDNWPQVASSHFHIGNFYELMGDYPAAIQHFLAAQKVYAEHKDQEGLADIFLDLGNVYDSQGDYAHASEVYQKALHLYEEMDVQPGVAFCLNNLGNLHEVWGNYAEATDYYLQALRINRNLQDTFQIAGNLSNVANLYANRDDYFKAILYYDEAIALCKNLNDQSLLAQCYLDKALVYRSMGDFVKAIDYAHLALNINNQLNLPSEVASCYNSIGDIHLGWGNMNKARHYFHDALKLYKQMDEKHGLAESYQNLAQLFMEEAQYDSALVDFREALHLYDTLGAQSGSAYCLHEIGNALRKKNEYTEAYRYFTHSKEIFESIHQPGYVAANLIAMGKVKLQQEKCAEALQLFREGYDQSVELNLIVNIQDAAKGLAQCYEEQNNIALAYHYFKEYKSLSDSIFNIENTAKLGQIESTYQLEQKEQQIALQESRITTQNLEIKQHHFARKIMISAIILALIIITLIAIAYFRLQQARNLILKQKEEIAYKNVELEQSKEEVLMQNENLSQQNEEILTQRDEIREQQQKILDINANISDSISYAKKIQQSMLPDRAVLKECFEDTFILLKPRDIVSGDFYWFRKIKNFIVVAAVDCTGHGVPGAIMSMLGATALNDIISKSSFDPADFVLNRLRDRVKGALRQKGNIGENKDGMDMSLIRYNLETKELQYAGANNPIYIIRDGELLIYKANHQPISFYYKETPFTLHNIQMQSGDMVYMFSDGYADQFGGEKNKKYTTRRFRQLLSQISALSCEQQKEALLQTHSEWKKGFEQIDDILVMGLKIN